MSNFTNTTTNTTSYDAKKSDINYLLIGYVGGGLILVIIVIIILAIIRNRKKMKAVLMTKKNENQKQIQASIQKAEEKEKKEDNLNKKDNVSIKSSVESEKLEDLVTKSKIHKQNDGDIVVDFTDINNLDNTQKKKEATTMTMDPSLIVDMTNRELLPEKKEDTTTPEINENKGADIPILATPKLSFLLLVESSKKSGQAKDSQRSIPKNWSKVAGSIDMTNIPGKSKSRDIREETNIYSAECNQLKAPPSIARVNYNSIETEIRSRPDEDYFKRKCEVVEKEMTALEWEKKLQECQDKDIEEKIKRAFDTDWAVKSNKENSLKGEESESADDEEIEKKWKVKGNGNKYMH